MPTEMARPTKEHIIGSRADFYTGRGHDATWLGSVAWDGHGVLSESETDDPSIDISMILNSTQWEASVDNFLRAAVLHEPTLPPEGWPWPWNDSNTTDYAYAWETDDNTVYVCSFGHGWYPADLAATNMGEPDDYYDLPRSTEFPDMTSIKKVKLGNGSGLSIF